MINPGMMQPPPQQMPSPWMGMQAAPQQMVDPNSVQQMQAAGMPVLASNDVSQDQAAMAQSVRDSLKLNQPPPTPPPQASPKPKYPGFSNSIVQGLNKMKGK